MNTMRRSEIAKQPTDILPSHVIKKIHMKHQQSRRHSHSFEGQAITIANANGTAVVIVDIAGSVEITIHQRIILMSCKMWVLLNDPKGITIKVLF
jgi:hypothetical protein